eukprot:scaffold4277_cov140-Skeletonema_menzelii.AAC.3
MMQTAWLFPLLLSTTCYALLPPSSPHTTKSSVTLSSFSSWNPNEILLSPLPPPRTSPLLFAVSSATEDPTIISPTNDEDNAPTNNLQGEITLHLNEAVTAQSQQDVTSQRNAVENASQTLMQWVELSKGVKSSMPGAEVFQSVIQGYLSLPSSIRIAQQQQEENESIQECITDNYEEELAEKNQIKSLLGKRTIKGQQQQHQQQQQGGDNTNSSPPHLATRILDVMESYYEPTPEVYDAIIASFGKCALEYLAQIPSLITESNHNDKEDIGVGGEDDDAIEQTKGDMATIDDNDDDEQSNQYSLYYSQAWKSAKAALQLLNRSEDLYHETGKQSNRLPSASSYATVMDVYKALAVNSAHVLLLVDSKKKSRDEALNVWKNLRQRRLEMYRLNDSGATGEGGRRSRYNILPGGVTKSVEDTFGYAYNLLCESSPSYAKESSELSRLMENEQKIGTYHFNQLIFDLAQYPQSFSGLLAQDLLEFMVARVASTPKKERENNPNVPKPTVETINGVLKAWMVTPNYHDAVARRVESVLAKLAGWQSDGTLWGVTPDTVSYNTCINCWKQSGIPGAAERATEILVLMEDDSTNIAPDAISYCSCMSAWAECAATNPRAGANAEAILTRMHSRGKENDDAPKPTTRCFNAVLLAYANGKQKGGGKRALELLRFMESLHSEGYVDCQPDSYTFNIVMKALTNSKETGAAQKANQLLRRMERSNDKGSTLQPDIFSYNIVLDAFSRIGDAESAEKLLQQMYDRSERGSIAKPNAHSYTAVLTAWARNGDGKAVATTRAEELFNNFERKYAAGETDVQADTTVYNALINVWAKSGERKALYRVTQILSTMEELGLQGGDESVAPNSRTYCAVLDCIARSRNFKAYNKALEVIKRMEDFYSEGHESVRPCARAYSIVISTIARSRKRDKAVKAQEMLRRMESEYVKGNVAARPTVYCYNGVLNAAAFTSGDERDQEEAFRVACLTFDELRISEYLQPTHVSYGTFLKSIRKLMPDSEIREKLVTSVFRRCCKEGLVGEMVLREMKALSSPDFYQSLMTGYDTKLGIPPKSFSANVVERDYDWRE